MIKAICQRCYRERWGDERKWTIGHDYRWEHGSVLCPDHLYYGITDKSLDEHWTPDHCRYYLEHLVLNQALPHDSSSDGLNSRQQEDKT